MIQHLFTNTQEDIAHEHKCTKVFVNGGIRFKNTESHSNNAGVAVYTLKSDGQLNHLNPADSLTDSVECISSLTGDCFEIRIILRLAREQRIRLTYFTQSFEMNCGWKTVAFAKEKTSPPCSFLIDHQRRMLYVGIEVLYQSHEVMLNLAKHFAEYLSIASDGQNPPSGGFFNPGNDRNADWSNSLNHPYF